MSLFERLMACETLEKLFNLASATSKEELQALTDDENAQIEAKIENLASIRLFPADEEEMNVETEEPIISEIIYPTVNFDNVAPFGAPVEG